MLLCSSLAPVCCSNESAMAQLWRTLFSSVGPEQKFCYNFSLSLGFYSLEMKLMTGYISQLQFHALHDARCCPSAPPRTPHIYELLLKADTPSLTNPPFLLRPTPPRTSIHLCSSSIPIYCHTITALPFIQLPHLLLHPAPPSPILWPMPPARSAASPAPHPAPLLRAAAGLTAHAALAVAWRVCLISPQLG